LERKHIMSRLKAVTTRPVYKTHKM
jgi:hypothetical protein